MQAWMNTTVSINNTVISATATEGIDIDFLELFLKCKPNSSFGSNNIKLSPSTLCQLFSNGKIIVTVADCGKEFGKVFKRVFSGEAVQVDSLRVLVAGDDILNKVVLVLYWMT